MRLPSIGQLLHSARATFLRFPIVLCDAVIGTAAALLLVDYEGAAQPTILFPILFASILGLPLFISLLLLAEHKMWKSPVTFGIHIIGLLLLVGYGLVIPQDYLNAPGFHLVRFLVLAAALHLLVSVAPFYERGELNGFWHYNKTLFIRALTALLYTGVLWIGLAVALEALDHLFGVSIPGKRYPELWILLNGIFCTWFFLSGVPEDLHALEALTEYPKGLKIFAQYILLPLVCVYLVILYAYLLKVVISWDWPQGWVSKLILGFAGTGIFALLLLQPISNRTEQVWIKTASRWFYVVLSPLIVMLFFAVWRRVSEYGVTEGRYLAIVLGGWLVGMVAYFTVSKLKSIKVVPATLLILLLAVSFGPWSIFAVSEQSQVGRLKTILLRDSILVDAKIHGLHSPVSLEDSKQISSIVLYLHDLHGYEGIESWFAETLEEDSLGKGLASLGSDVVTGKMGVTYTNAWRSGAGRDGFVFVDVFVDNERATDVRDFELLVRGLHISAEELTKNYPRLGLSCRTSKQLDTITFILAPGIRALDTLRVDLHQLVRRVMDDNANADLTKIPPEQMSVTAVGRQWKVKVMVREAYVERRASEQKAVWYNLDILYSLNEKEETIQ